MPRPSPQTDRVVAVIELLSSGDDGATMTEIAEHGHVLTPGRYVGAEAVEDDDEGFEAKMQALTEKLGEQMAKGAELDAVIRQRLARLGYEF